MAFCKKLTRLYEHKDSFIKLKCLIVTTCNLKMPPKEKKSKKSDDFEDFLEAITKNREGSKLLNSPFYPVPS